MVKHARKTVVAWIVLSLLLAPSALTAKEKRGAWLRIEKSDGSLVEGELLKVSGETLVLFDNDNQHGVQVGLGDVQRLGLRRKWNALKGIAIGFAASLVASRVVSAIAIKDDPDEENLGFIFLSIFTAPPAMRVGGLIHGLWRPFRKMIVNGFQEEDRDKILAKRRTLSRAGRNDASWE